jgi:hypothetical protein
MVDFLIIAVIVYAIIHVIVGTITGLIMINYAGKRPLGMEVGGKYVVFLIMLVAWPYLLYMEWATAPPAYLSKTLPDHILNITLTATGAYAFYIGNDLVGLIWKDPMSASDTVSWRVRINDENVPDYFASFDLARDFVSHHFRTA